MTAIRGCRRAALVLGLMAVTAARGEPLAPPRATSPSSPVNKKATARFGAAADLPTDGYFLYTTSEGLAISPIRLTRSRTSTPSASGPCRLPPRRRPAPPPHRETGRPEYRRNTELGTPGLMAEG